MDIMQRAVVAAFVGFELCDIEFLHFVLRYGKDVTTNWPWG